MIKMRVFLVLLFLFGNIEICYGGCWFSKLKATDTRPVINERTPLLEKVAVVLDNPGTDNDGIPVITTNFEDVANQDNNQTQSSSSTAIAPSAPLDFDSETEDGEKLAKTKSWDLIPIKKVSFLNELQITSALTQPRKGAIFGDEKYTPLTMQQYQIFAGSIIGSYSKNTLRFFMDIKPQYSNADIVLAKPIVSSSQDSNVQHVELYNLENPLEGIAKDDIKKRVLSTPVNQYNTGNLNEKILSSLQNNVVSGNVDAQDAMKGQILDKMTFLGYMCRRVQLMQESCSNDDGLQVDSDVIIRRNLQGKIDYIYLAVSFKLKKGDVKYYSEGGILLRFDFEKNLSNMYIIRPGIAAKKLQ